MKVTEKKNNNETLTLIARVTSDEVDDALDKAQAAFAQQMNLSVQSGEALVEAAKRSLGITDLDSIVRDQALEYLGPFALEKKGIVPLYPPDQPRGKGILKRGSAYEFEVNVVPKPTFLLSSYDPVAVTVEPFEIDDEVIEGELNRSADSFARFIPEEPRPVKADDMCLIDISASKNGKPVDALTYEGLSYVMNAGYLPPEFDEHLLGMDVGETKEFILEIPSLDPQTSAEAINCVVTLKSIQKREQPEMTDEWVAANIPPYQSVADLRKSIKERVFEDQRKEYDNYVRQAVVSELTKRFSETIPDGAYRAMQDAMINKMRIEFQQQGSSLDEYIEQNGGKQQFQMMLMMQIKENLTQGYALDAVYQHENLLLSDNDIDAACAALNPQYPEVVKEQMMQSGRGFALREMAERMKTSRWLVDHANITTVSSTGE